MKLIMKYLTNVWVLLNYGVDFLTSKLVQSFDKFERQEAFKKRHPESSKWGRFKLYLSLKFMAKIDRRHSTLKEQKAFIENLLLGLRFYKPDLQTINFISESTVFRPITRIRFKQLAFDKADTTMSVALRGKNILEDELIALIEVAESNTEFEEMYLLILEDIEDRIARQRAFRKMLIFPIVTAVSLVLTEVYIALSVVPMMVENTAIDDFSSAPTINSYFQLREAILHPDFTIFLKIMAWGAGAFFIYSLNSTKWIMDLFFLIVPKLKEVIIKWEISKMFNSLRCLARTNKTIYDSAYSSVGVIKNRVIKSSLKKDIDYNTNVKKSPTFYDMFETSVYVDRFILDQLKYSKEINADANLILESVYKENKDSMKDILEAPSQIMGPVVAAIVGVYIVLRLLPIYPEMLEVMDKFY